MRRLSRHRAHVLAICVVLLLAAGLRVYGLAGQSLWLDEVLSVKEAQRLLDQGLEKGLFNRRGPLYFYVLAAVVPGGTGEALLRLPSVLFGLGLVLVIYFLGRVLLSPRGGLLASLLAAISPFAVWYSQETRYVSLFILLSALSMLFAHRYSVSGARRDLFFYGLLTLLMLYSFIGGIFLVLGMNVWYWSLRPSRSRLRDWLLGHVIIMFIFVPWCLRAYDVMSRSNDAGAEQFSLGRLETGYSRPARIAHLGYVGFTFGVGFSFGPSTDELHRDSSLAAVRRTAPQVIIATLFLGAIGLAGLWFGWRASPRGSSLAWICMLSAIGGAYGMAIISRVAFNVRYTAGAFPAFLVVLAAGILWCIEHPRIGGVLALGMLAVLGSSLLNYYGDQTYARDDNRGAARLLEEERRRDEHMVFGAGGIRALRYYYHAPFHYWSDVELVHHDPAATQSEVPAPERLWLVVTRPWQLSGFDDFKEAVLRCHPIERRFDLSGYEIYLLRTRRADGGPLPCSLRFPTAHR